MLNITAAFPDTVTLISKELLRGNEPKIAESKILYENCKNLFRENI